MFRRRPRTSRTLIGILVVVIALGLVSYWHNTSESTAEPAPDLTATKTPPPAEPVVPARTETPAGNRAKAPEAPMTTVTPSAPVAGTSASPAKPAAAKPLTPAPKPMQSPTTQPKTAAAPSGPPLVQAKAQYQAGELLEAREIANNALIAGNLSPADTQAAKDLIKEINQTIVFAPNRYPKDTFGGSYSVKSGDNLSKIARNYDITAELLCRINGISDPRKLRAGATIKVVTGPFHAVVDKSDYTMDLYLGEPEKSGSMYITTFRVGLGAQDSTPTGIWMVETDTKLKNPQYHSPRGEGIIAADDPKNPLGEFWIGLTGIEGDAVGKPSYGIHGTIEPDSIGKQASLGCIRLLNEDVAIVYEMLVEGKSTVIVKE